MMVTYRLQLYPDVCVHCLSPTSKHSTSIHQYEEEMGTSLEAAVMQIMYNLNSPPALVNYDIEYNKFLPRRICKTCRSAIVTFYKYYQRVKLVRQFTAGLAQLIQGNPEELIQLYATAGADLVEFFKTFKICSKTDENITIETLIADLPTFTLINRNQQAQYTVIEPNMAVPSNVETMATPNALLSQTGVVEASPMLNWVVDSNTEENLATAHETHLPEQIFFDVGNWTASECRDTRTDGCSVPVANGGEINNEKDYSPGDDDEDFVDLTLEDDSPLPNDAGALTCLVCKKTFESSMVNIIDILKHSALHDVANHHTCIKCLRAFRDERNLKSHLRVVHRIPCVRCEDCNAGFKAFYMLKAHREIVHGLQSYFYCDICMDQFPNELMLRCHNRRHKTPKMTDCAQCAKAFSTESDLQNHVCITFLDEYKCCGKKFAGHVFYNQHMLTVHNKHVEARVKIPPDTLLYRHPVELGGLDFHCTLCNKRYGSRKMYQRHLESQDHITRALTIPQVM